MELSLNDLENLDNEKETRRQIEHIQTQIRGLATRLAFPPSLHGAIGGAAIGVIYLVVRGLVTLQEQVLAIFCYVIKYLLKPTGKFLLTRLEHCEKNLSLYKSPWEKVEMDDSQE